MNIADFFNSNPSQFINTLPFMIKDDSISTEKGKISMPFLASEMKYYEDLGIDNEINRVISHEISSKMSRSFAKELFETSNFDYLDLISSNLDAFSMDSGYLNKLVDMILNSGYKNLITTGLLGSCLQDSSRFFVEFNNQDVINRSPANLYSAGKLVGYSNEVNIYVDPYMRFNDGRMCMFNEVLYVVHCAYILG